MEKRIIMQQFLGYTGNRSFSRNAWSDGSVNYTEVTTGSDGMGTIRYLDTEPYIATPMPGPRVYPEHDNGTKL